MELVNKALCWRKKLTLNRLKLIIAVWLSFTAAAFTTFAQTFDEIERGRHAARSSLKRDRIAGDSRPKVLLVVGDGAEVLDTMVPFYRLGEDYRVVVAGPEKGIYHLVVHELVPGWDITQERPGYRLDSGIALEDVDPDHYAALVLPGGRAPEYLRYDKDLIRITKDFFAKNKPVASICHGVEILATADVIRGKKVTTIPKCRFDVEAVGAVYVSDPVVRSGNLLCARGKKDLSPWLKQFVEMIEESLPEKVGKASSAGAAKDKDGFVVHEVDSPYQKGKTQICVLAPDRMEKDKQYRVVYVLPVEPGNGTEHGNGLVEIKKLDLHNRFGIIFVMPTFSDWPWYCDHPTDPMVRQETYFVEVVVRFIEKTYPSLSTQEGRLLLGFSKSGLGAFTLLLRHPDFFGRAAAWDAPLKMAKPNQIFATQENFDKYQVSTLLTKEATKLKTHSRLAIIGYSKFAKYRPHHQAIHEQMARLDIPHKYQDVCHGKHDWRSGWLEDAVRFLVSR